MENHVFDQDLIAQFARGRSLTPSPHDQHDAAGVIRLSPPSNVATGYEDGIIVDRDLYVTVKNLRSLERWEDVERGQKLLVFCFHLGGRRIVETEGHGTFELKAPTFAAFYQGPECSKRSIWGAGERELSVLIGFRLDAPPRSVRFPIGSIGESLERNLKPLPPFFWKTLPLTPDMASAAWDIISPSVGPDYLLGYWQVKALELLCLGGSALWSRKAAEPADISEAIYLRRRLDSVRKFLESNIGEPPRIASLAKLIQVSPMRLTSEFRKAFGVTIQDFVRRSRMEQGRTLLATTDLALKQIAYRVGFHHTSNFCTAFRREFGVTPNEFRSQSSEGPAAAAIRGTCSAMRCKRNLNS